MEKKDKYKKILEESKLFFSGPVKGSYILPPNGYSLWKNIQDVLDRKFSSRGARNVILPTLIPVELLEKEKEHVEGFSPELFYVSRIGDKSVERLILRPTSEVSFYEWYRKTLISYQQLPFIYNQWCSVFRAEKNTNPFLRNTEFLWQEGHTLHSSENEARNFSKIILSDYEDYAKNSLYLNVIVGKKTEGEKFAGAKETYSVECLLPDGQCLQLATSHYFGDSFCKIMKISYRDKRNFVKTPFSTSWGTSTRAIGAIVKSHSDDSGVVMPFEIAPVQVALVPVMVGKNDEKIQSYISAVSKMLSPFFRWCMYDKHPRTFANLNQADAEGCPLKILIGKEEVAKNTLTLVRRDKISEKVVVEKEKIVEEINRQKEIFKKNVIDKISEIHRDKVKELGSESDLLYSIKGGNFSLFIIPFCNSLKCEISSKEKLSNYSFRCIKGEASGELCVFCKDKAKVKVYVGRSY